MKRAEGFWFCINPYGNIIGTVGLRKMCVQNFEFGEIRRFYVDKCYQGQGIGKKLFNHVLMFAKQNNYTCLRGTTSKNASAVMHVIEKLGFVEIPQYRDSCADIFFELMI